MQRSRRAADRHGQAIMARLTTLSPENAVCERDLAWFGEEIAVLDGETPDLRPPPRRPKLK